MMQSKNNHTQARGWFPAACLSLLLFSPAAHSTERTVPLNWLKTVAFAAHQTDYSGVFVYQFGNNVETSRIAHVVRADSEYEKIESLDGPKRQIIRHHGQVWCYRNHQMTQVSQHRAAGRFPTLLPMQMSVLEGNYTVREAGEERIAGYNTQVILFQPRDGLRYTRKIWAHTESGLLLKAAVLDDKGKVVEQYTFTQLKIGNIDDLKWIDDAPAAVQGGDSVPTEGEPVQSGWVVDAMPPGFSKTLEVVRPMHGKHAPVIHMVYSDGLGAISIFIEPSDSDEDDVEGLSSRGSVNLYHRLTNGHLVTVVGEVPPRAVMQVLGSVRFAGKS